MCWTIELSTRRLPGCFTVLLVMGCMIQAPVHAQEMNWHPFEEALVRADTSGRLVLVDVWAPWCGWCHKMRREVYPRLESQLNKHFVLTRLNRDDNETTHKYQGKSLTPLRIAQHLRVTAVPSIVILRPGGDYLLHVSGYVHADQLRPVLEQVIRDTQRPSRL